ncbi:phosphoglycolate phosphatase [Thiofilum flexile]|uniref:phosphoglycolate phosphatase n=1 Tax=Thiofilum flexile TaxID=125627 RepID=UPI00035D8914|nr:phosphoglycolate phosphatase [Thiofilum flexile]
MPLKPQLVLCDLDGTLVDSVPDLAYSIDQTMLVLGLPARGEEAVRHWVGNGLQNLVARALCNDMHGNADPELLAKALPIYMSIYRQHTSERSHVYDGVVEGLDYLKQCSELKLGCVTNKADQFTQVLLKDMGLSGYFDLVISGDTLPEKKPHPLPLLHAAEYFGVKPQHCLMIGDSKSDVQAARAAGFHIICTSYGYNHGEDIRNYHPDYVIDSFVELKQLITCR